MVSAIFIIIIEPFGATCCVVSSIDKIDFIASGLTIPFLSRAFPAPSSYNTFFLDVFKFFLIQIYWLFVGKRLIVQIGLIVGATISSDVKIVSHLDVVILLHREEPRLIHLQFLQFVLVLRVLLW